ncbi:PARVB protein, partial [Polypterus senegalus]
MYNPDLVVTALSCQSGVDKKILNQLTSLLQGLAEGQLLCLIHDPEVSFLEDSICSLLGDPILPVANGVLHGEAIQEVEQQRQRLQEHWGILKTQAEENAERSMLDPASREDPKFKELLRVLIDWINNELEEERIIVKDLEEDLYDGQVLQKLFEKLSGRKLNVAEVTQSEIGQKQKLQTVLEAVNDLLRPNGWAIEWSVDAIHSKNLVPIVFLLVALAMHFQAPIRLPEHVSIHVILVKDIVSKVHCILLHFFAERDAFDTLLDHAPDKLNVVKKSLITFVNKHLNKLNLEVTELETQWATMEGMDQEISEIFAQASLQASPCEDYSNFLGGKNKLIHPQSLKDARFEQLKEVLISWINDKLKKEHIVIQSLEKDLYDGLILHHLFVKLSGVELKVEEIALTESAQKRKLTIILEAVNEKLNLPADESLKWSVNDPIEELLKLAPEKVNTVKQVGYLPTARVGMKGQMFTCRPCLLIVLLPNFQAILHFVNKNLEGLGLRVNDMNTQFADGVMLILLIGQLGGYFINLNEYCLTPSSNSEMPLALQYLPRDTWWQPPWVTLVPQFPAELHGRWSSPQPIGDVGVAARGCCLCGHLYSPARKCNEPQVIKHLEHFRLVDKKGQHPPVIGQNREEEDEVA